MDFSVTLTLKKSDLIRYKDKIVWKQLLNGIKQIFLHFNTKYKTIVIVLCPIKRFTQT